MNSVQWCALLDLKDIAAQDCNKAHPKPYEVCGAVYFGSILTDEMVKLKGQRRSHEERKRGSGPRSVSVT